VNPDEPPNGGVGGGGGRSKHVLGESVWLVLVFVFVCASARARGCVVCVHALDSARV
jgi:hypothetical protein